MKRGKGEEKLMGPMFPRLHVNDKEKGGPRAPPRNKMALYEQLSIPSQRYKHGVLHNSNSGSLVTSPSQGSGHERDVSFSVQLPPSRHPAEKPRTHSSNSKTPSLPAESNKKTEEDDFRVPVLINSKAGQGNGKFYCTLDGVKLSASTAVLSGHSKKDLIKENPKQPAVSREPSCNSSSILSMDKPDGVMKQAHVTLHYEPRDDSENTFGIFSKNDRLRPEYIVGSQVGGSMFSEPVMVLDDGDSSEKQLNSNNISSDTESKDDKASKSLQTGIADQSDDLSETSMVESLSGTYITPDDVVGVIGQKHFWKARRAIANQQRAFAVQVFELHRLLKVQRLIACSESTLEDSANLGKPVKSSSAKRLPLEYIVRDPQNVPKQRKDFEKPNGRMECSAENMVDKAPFSTVQNGSQPSSYNPFSGHPVTNDSNMGPLCFNQPSGHQWLIPVMSPSEGLVYKPYPGPGVPSSVYGGYGPQGSTPMAGNPSASFYGVPASHHHYQGIEMSFAPPAGHAYFPPYGMPFMNPAISSSAVDQSNQFAAQGLQSQLLGGVNYYVQRQNSSNMPSNNSGTVPDVKSHASRNTELQASTASSPSGRAHRIYVDNTMEGRDVLPLFPTSPATIENPESRPQPHVPSHPRVIKVVPHNSRTATESAARIFQSIQEERNQYDSGFTHQ